MTAASELPAESCRDAHTRMLRRLAELGMELAELTTRQAKAAVEADPQALLTGVDLQFSRIARAVRMTVMLEQRVEEGRAAAAATRAPYQPWVEAGLTEEAYRRRSTIRARASVVYETIEKAIETEEDETRQDELTVDLSERMRDGRDEALFACQAPLADVIAAICRDLGFEPDWSELDTDELLIDEPSLARLRLGRFATPPPDPDVTEAAAPDPTRPRSHPPPWMS